MRDDQSSSHDRGTCRAVLHLRHPMNICPVAQEFSSVVYIFVKRRVSQPFAVFDNKANGLPIYRPPSTNSKTPDHINAMKWFR